MRELVHSNDAVLLSYVDALLSEADIEHAVVDAHMSIIEGSIGILPRRVLVKDEHWLQALRILHDAGLAHVCAEPRK